MKLKYQIIKVLNNNSILAKQGNDEVILLAKGIGFQKKVNDIFEAPANTKTFLMVKQDVDKKKTQDILKNVNPIYIEISSEIIRYATEKFDKVDTKILLPLADHIDFAIQRLNEGMTITNPFTKDIQLLFPDEYEVAKKGKELIQKMTGQTINDDEIDYITLHVHSAISKEHVYESMEATQVIHESIDQLKKDLKIEIDSNSISYIRLMNHIKFLFLRLQTHEQLQMNISDFTKERFPFAYQQAENICLKLSKVLHQDIPHSEIGYLALHLERILSISLQNEN